MKRVLWLIVGCVSILIVSSMFMDNLDSLLFRLYGGIISFAVVLISMFIIAYYLGVCNEFVED